MIKALWKPLMLGLALVVLGTRAVQARSGRAAYHSHTSEMVTAARHEPVGSVLLVRNPQNGRTVKVRVNDRGPFNGNRILDLSTGAFRALYGGLRRGVGPVEYVVVSRGGSPRSRASSYSSSRKKRGKRGHYRYRSHRKRR